MITLGLATVVWAACDRRETPPDSGRAPITHLATSEECSFACAVDARWTCEAETSSKTQQPYYVLEQQAVEVANRERWKKSKEYAGQRRDLERLEKSIRATEGESARREQALAVIARSRAELERTPARFLIPAPPTPVADRVWEEERRCNADRAAQCVTICTSQWPAGVAGCVANSESLQQMRPCLTALENPSLAAHAGEL
jgi:hypothetical protein